ncbi:MAG: hypothetical protein H8E66_20255 [Planctomycetes bacterium]|nr:hypothetical protein [Planctomycetota bacterium]
MNFNVTTLAVVMLLSGAASAAEPVVTALREAIDKSIDWYQLFPSENDTKPMKPIVALRWPNNIRGSTDGATVVWVDKGRAEAVVAIYPWEELFIHEFDSLSRGTLVARSDEEVVWNPNKPGLQFHPIDDVPPPAESALVRLRQMKSLTKHFKATLLGWVADNSQREELRMMTRPIYRYEIDKPDKVQDGAIFAYATGTDPEVLLVIEAFGDAGRYAWQYAFVRRSSGGLEGRIRNKIVWVAEKYPQKKNRQSNHVEFSRPLDEVLATER